MNCDYCDDEDEGWIYLSPKQLAERQREQNLRMTRALERLSFANTPRVLPIPPDETT